MHFLGLRKSVDFVDFFVLRKNRETERQRDKQRDKQRDTTKENERHLENKIEKERTQIEQTRKRENTRKNKGDN